MSIYFSIIIPCLNESKYLPKILQNLNDQNYQSFETIIIDANSEDHTAELARTYKTSYPITILTTQKRNPSYQRNIGSKLAKGKVLIFMDADTQIPSNYLSGIRHAFETKRPHMLTTHINVDSTKASDQIFSTFVNTFFEITKYFETPSVYGAMMAIKKNVFDDIEGFDENISYSEDSQLFHKGIINNYKYIVLSNPKYTFSLRRFRKEGTLDTIYKYMSLYLNTHLNGYITDSSKYPMGGHIHENNLKPKFLTKYDNFISQINKLPKNQLTKIKSTIKQLFSE